MPDSEKKLKRAIIKEELVALTGEWLKAVILQQFLYWGERVKDFDAFILEERLRKNEPDLELTHGWIWKSVKGLKDEVMVKPLSEDTVRRRIAEIVQAGWLEERNNPYHKWDRTLQYRPNIRQIQRELQELGYALEHYPLLIENSTIPHPAESKPQDEETTTLDAESNPDGAEALPEITIETKEENKKDSPAQLLFTALADVCRYDLTTITKTQRGQLNQSEKKLRQAGATPELLSHFETWWYKHDWRGQKEEDPKPAQVREEWGRFMNWYKSRQSPSNGPIEPREPDPPYVQTWERVKESHKKLFDLLKLGRTEATGQDNGIIVVTCDRQQDALNLKRRQHQLLLPPDVSFEFVTRGEIR